MADNELVGPAAVVAAQAMAAEYDLEQLAEDNPLGIASDDKLRRVAEIAETQLKGEAWVAAMEEKLKQAKAKLRQITEVDLPEAMDAAGVSEFTTTEGRKIKVEPYITASLAEGKMPGAVQWLREHEADALVQRVFTLTFPKGQETEAERVAKVLKLAGVEPKDESRVNTTSLKAWAREKLAEGAALPLETFGMYVGRRAVIK